MSNLKFAFRTLFKTPFVTIVAIVSLALGIGANAAIFSLFNQMLLQPLPAAEPNRLVNLLVPGPKPGSQSCNQASTRGNCDDVLSYPMFRDLEREQQVFAGLAAHRLVSANIAYGGQTVNGDLLLVSGSYFGVLGIQPAVGRLIGPGDDRIIGESPVVVLSHGFWTTRFAADRGLLNQTMIVNGQAMTIVGVAPRGFTGTTIGAEPKVFVPLTLRKPVNPWSERMDNRRNYFLYVFGRLKPGVSIEQARASLDPQYRAIVNDVEATLQTGMSPQTLARFKTKPILLEPGARGQSAIPNTARPSLRLLLGVTAFVLIIACANIANLLLARSAARAGEMAVRLSIGASRGRLVFQLLTESLLLAVLGGIAGMFVAQWTLDLIASLLPNFAATTLDFHVDRTAMLFGAALTIGTGLLFGLFPAIHSTRPDLVSSLKGQAGQPSGARAAARFRTSLATAQIALSMALLVSAGLFTKSLMNISRVDLGVKVDNVIMFGLSPELNGYTPARTKQLFERLEEELAALPGVNGVTSALVPLLGGSNWGNDVAVEGFPAGPDTDTNSRFNEVGPEYFRTLGVPLIAGREFRRADGAGAPKVAIVNEAFAKKFNLGRDAVGRRIGNRGDKEGLDTQIVGLVQNAKYSEVKREVPPLFFRPYRQDDRLGNITFYVRTSLDPEQFLPNVPKVVAKLDANLPVEDLRTMPQQIRQNVFLDRMISVLSAAFAGLATLLAAIGLYGVLAYTVSQRTREIGLRMALGAAPSRVRGMVLRQVGVMTIVGGVIGLTAAIWLGRLAQSLLFEMKGYDPVVLVSAAAALSVVALGAGFVPAHRASQVDPMQALRYE
ncbi:MAG: multidrug ABC transporter substrate-binding protein [Acidobacteria bacterium]|nr:MAG: multidrug ABC transporter substrate-binding protein [Acidobacteriota bacterium]